MLDLSTLNQEQLLPVMDTEGAVLVTAGAGSGKTKLLTYRIANLIKNADVPPYNILAITFTNKAAREMKERLSMLVPQAQDIFISTFHSMCVSILRKFIESLNGGRGLDNAVSFDGSPLSKDSLLNSQLSNDQSSNGQQSESVWYSRNFSIYDESERKKVIKLVAKEVDKENENLVDAVDVALSRIKNAGKDISDYAFDYKFLPDIDNIVECMHRYQSAMIARNALDFDDLLAVCLQLLEQSKAARQYYQQRFRYIHVDEFQDTNVIQYKLVKILSGGHGNVFAVGDEDQSIYGWRGANIENIRHFIRDFDCRIYKLEQNYRSSKSILELANSVIKNNTSRIEKQLWTENDEGQKPQLYQAGSDGDEADFVMQTVKGLHSMGQPYNSMAVLMRINALSRSIEQKFMFYGIPYKLYGGFKFYERREIKDILAYLKLTDNNKDDEAVLRAIAFPKKGIGDTSVSKMLDLGRSLKLSLYDIIMAAAGGQVKPQKGQAHDVLQSDTQSDADAALSFKVKQELGGALCAKLSSLALQLKAIDENKKNKVSILLKFIYNLLKLTEVFGNDTEEDENRKLNVLELISSVGQTERQNPDMTLSDYLQQIMLYSDLDNEPEGDSVCLFTVHSAKGLEFDTVFIIGAEDGLFPLARSINSPGEIEEERRLMYVAFTRAKKRLFVSHTRTRFMYGQYKRSVPSRFLYESGLLRAVKKEESMLSFDVDNTATVGLGGYQRTSSAGGATGFKLNSLPSSGVDMSKIKEGTSIKHKRLGKGLIKSVDSKNRQADVDFESIGLITLSLEFAPITILD